MARTLARMNRMARKCDSHGSHTSSHDSHGSHCDSHGSHCDSHGSLARTLVRLSSGIVFSCIVNNLLVVCHYVSFPNDHFAKHICKVFAKHIYNVEVKW